MALPDSSTADALTPWRVYLQADGHEECCEGSGVSAGGHHSLGEMVPCTRQAPRALLGPLWHLAHSLCVLRGLHGTFE